jgi:hypothetical protein
LSAIAAAVRVLRQSTSGTRDRNLERDAATPDQVSLGSMPMPSDH